VFGERPFAGDSPAALLASISEGHVRDPSPESNAPGWLRVALLRGLRAAPEDRFPDMDALLVQLARDPRAALRRRLVAAVGIAGIIGTGFAVYQGLDANPRPSCSAGESRLAGTWDANVKASVRRTFLATGLPYAEDAWAAVERSLDGYSSQWTATYRDTCEATHVRGEQSARMLDLRMQCLESRRKELGELARLLSLESIKGSELEHAVEAAASLPDLDGCSDVRALDAVTPAPTDPAALAKLEEIKAALAKGRALSEMLRFPEARDVLSGATSAARVLGYRPLLAESLRLLGRVQRGLKDYAASRQSFLDSLLTAESDGDEEQQARAWIQLVMVDGAHLQQPDRGHEDARHAASLLERIGNKDRLEAERLYALSIVLYRQERWEESLTAAKGAVETMSRTAPGDTTLVTYLTNVSLVLEIRGAFDEALEVQQRALGLAETLYGATHPRTAKVESLVAGVFERKGLRAEQRLHLERALAIQRRSLAPSTPIRSSRSSPWAHYPWKKGSPRRPSPRSSRCWRYGRSCSAPTTSGPSRRFVTGEWRSGGWGASTRRSRATSGCSSSGGRSSTRAALRK